jgi:glycosyltransferase involved in cell wall biosynthesis
LDTAYGKRGVIVLELQIAIFAFWVGVLTVSYIYIGYPLLLSLRITIARPRQIVRDDYEPSVTLIISAYNECDVIAEKLDNSLCLDYPRNRLEIIVVSDASTDSTDEIVAKHAEDDIRLIRMPKRIGKSEGLNEAVKQASGEIIVFSDANAMYDVKAIRQLVRNFVDRRVGAVTGQSRYIFDRNDVSTEVESRYWSYELYIKNADGAIYAIRKILYHPLDASDLSDFVNPLQIVMQGYRNVYEPGAMSYEHGAMDFQLEFRRKVRIVNRGFRATMKLRQLLNPFRYGFFAIQIWSHKLLRWFVWLLALIIFASNIMLLGQSMLYVVTLISQLTLYLAAFFGMIANQWLGLSFRILNIPFYFCIVNVAAMIGMIQVGLGHRYTTWETARGESTQAG